MAGEPFHRLIDLREYDLPVNTYKHYERKNCKFGGFKYLRIDFILLFRQLPNALDAYSLTMIILLGICVIRLEHM